MDHKIIKRGDYVSRDHPRGEVSTYRVFAVERFAIYYDEVDGVINHVEENIGGTLAEAVAKWRVATPAEIERFESNVRPWYPVQ